MTIRVENNNLVLVAHTPAARNIVKAIAETLQAEGRQYDLVSVTSTGIRFSIPLDPLK